MGQFRLKIEELAERYIIPGADQKGGKKTQPIFEKIAAV